MAAFLNGFMALVALSSVVTLTLCDVVTSLDKIKDMVLLESSMLRHIKSSLNHHGTDPGFDQFYTKRLDEIRTRNVTKELSGLSHPNGVFALIKKYAEDYRPLRDISSRWPEDAGNQLQRIANDNDVWGAQLSLVRLQDVYNMKPRNMIKGNYLGYKGPALRVLDAYQIGQTAFSEAKFNLSIAWLEAALKFMKPVKPRETFNAGDRHHMDQQGQDQHNPEGVSRAAIRALLGRNYLRLLKVDKARELLNQARSEEPGHGDVRELTAELKNPPEPWPQEQTLANYKLKGLCARQNNIPGSGVDPNLYCRYRVIFLPYNRYHEEIIRWSPFISVFYDVITDQISEQVRALAKQTLYTAGITLKGGTATNYLSRTGHVTFIEDWESALVHRISETISLLTGLRTEISPQGFVSQSQSAAEPLQVVNYGMGGHYNPHHDPFQMRNKQTQLQLDYSGDRLATFLLYLTKVERGGSTAFPLIDTVISPIKNSAVFWYSYTPSGLVDELTLHASCPVVVGEKWVCNKWILNYGNTFSRRCGLSEQDTHKDVEADMRRGYKAGRKRLRRSAQKNRKGKFAAVGKTTKRKRSSK